MTATAPERRKGPDGWEIKVRDEWLPAEDPSSMVAWTEWQDGKAAPSLLDHVARKPSSNGTAHNGTSPAGEPTARQREVWEAVQEHGTQGAAAKALGIKQSSVQAGLKGYMKRMGIEGPMPGYQPKVKPKRSERFDTKGHAPEQTPPQYVPPKPKPSVLVKPESTPSGPAGDLSPGHWRDDAQAKPVADERSDHHETIPAPEQSDPGGGPEVSTIVDAHRDGYARGYAVAVLRVLSTLDINDQLRDMATDAADGLMS